jgi:hypothetical protein
VLVGLTVAFASPGAWSLVVILDVVVESKVDFAPSADGSEVTPSPDSTFMPTPDELIVVFDPVVTGLAISSDFEPGLGLVTVFLTSFGAPAITPGLFTESLKDVQMTTPIPPDASARTSGIESFVDSPIPGGDESARTVQFGNEEESQADGDEILSEYSYFLLLGAQQTGLFDSSGDLSFFTTETLIEFLVELKDSESIFTYSEFGLETDFSKDSETYLRAAGHQYFGRATIAGIIDKVPEPGSLLLLGIGLLVLAVIAVRRGG